VALSTLRRNDYRSAGLQAGVADRIIARRVAGIVICVVAAGLVVVPAEAGTHAVESLPAQAGSHAVESFPAEAGSHVPGPGSQTGPPDQSSFDALRTRAERARAEGRLDEALAAYGEAVILQPSWIEGHWYLGTMYYETGRFRQCRDAFGRVLSLQQDNGAAWAFKGLCEFQVKDYASAMADLERGRELGLGDSPELVAVVRFHDAMLATRAGRYEGALQDLAGFARQGNTSEELALALGLALLRMPLVPGEITHAQREMVLTAGRALLVSGGRASADAVKALARLAEQYPDAPNVHYAYGLFLTAEHPDEALEQFQQELRISPDHAMARVQIAQEQLKRGEREAALPLATEAARLAPDNFVARRLLGQLRLETGDVQEAIAELETAKGLQPDSPSVRFQLARAYQRAKRTADAEREREEFRRLEKLQQLQRGGPDIIVEPPPGAATEPPADKQPR
jgi:tetratricopeptide (TPR) repeat protein